MKTLSAYDVALYFLYRARELDAGDVISNLKMQKMLYYAQGNFLSITKKPLFKESIEAWKHGPVVKKIYDRFKKYGKLAIDFKELDGFKHEIYDKIHLDILPFIFNKYNAYSAWELRNKTHNETPWLVSYDPFITKEIPVEIIKDFFIKQAKKEAQSYL